MIDKQEDGWRMRHNHHRHHHNYYTIAIHPLLATVQRTSISPTPKGKIPGSVDKNFTLIKTHDAIQFISVTSFEEPINIFYCD